MRKGLKDAWTFIKNPEQYYTAKREELLKLLREKAEEEGDFISDEVYKAMGKVQRHKFCLPEDQTNAYDDEILPFVGMTTLSQPYVVALTSSALGDIYGKHVFEVGAGSGYQAAVLSELVGPSGVVVTISSLK